MRTWAGAVEATIDKVKGSRFLGYGAPVRTEADAAAFVAEVQAAHRKATHVAFAWILPDGTSRAGDDGEVAGTAGPPSLARLEGADLRGVVVAVVRYYGGVNLGKGGLVRAYGATAAAVVEAAEVVVEEQRVRATVTVEAAHGSAVLALVTRAGFTILDARWGGEVVFVVEGPLDAADVLQSQLDDAARGTARWDLSP
jgi:putative IMPACT (imprinted ancient) family translation regulator